MKASNLSLVAHRVNSRDTMNLLNRAANQSAFYRKQRSEKQSIRSRHWNGFDSIRQPRRAGPKTSRRAGNQADHTDGLINFEKFLIEGAVKNFPFGF